jgi:hypothetical protein
MTRLLVLIWVKREAEYFCGHGWTGSIGLIEFEKFAVRRKIIRRAPSLRANGSRERAPDDRLREAIDPSVQEVWIASSLCSSQ